MNQSLLGGFFSTQILPMHKSFLSLRRVIRKILITIGPSPLNPTFPRCLKKSPATILYHFLKSTACVKNVHMDLYVKEGQSMSLPIWSEISLRLCMGRGRQMVFSANYPRLFDGVVHSILF